jgi:hypothetical protein
MGTEGEITETDTKTAAVDDSWLQAPERTAVFQAFMDSLEEKAVLRAKIKGIDSNFGARR